MEIRARNVKRKVTIPLKRHNRRKPKTALKGQKTVAKVGMTGSLGALLVSGFLKFNGAKSVHIYSGFGLLAFTVWHHFLNQPDIKPKR